MKKIKNNTTTITNIIASSGSFDIELIESLGTDDYKSLMEISASLAEDYGEKYLLTKNTINKYFNRSGALPIIARFDNKIIGYIIGMPLELLSQEPWVRLDENYGKFNTLYTYAFVIKNDFKRKGYAKILKKVYISWAKKKREFSTILDMSNQVFLKNLKVKSKLSQRLITGKVQEKYLNIIVEI